MVKKTVEYIKIPKNLFYIGLALVVVVFLFYTLRSQPVLVEVSQIKKGEFIKSVIEEGITRFSEKHVITAPADGIIPSHNWEVGDQVEKGQKLVTFLWQKDFVIKSPLTGYLLKIYEKDRKHVTRGAALFEVGSPEKLEVVAPVLTSEAVLVKPGMPVEIKNWGSDETLLGEVRRIEPAGFEEISVLGVKEQRVNVIIDFKSEKRLWDRIGDGYKVEVQIQLQKQPNSLLLPIGALIEKNEKPAIYTVENNKAFLKHVEIGERNDQYAKLRTPVEPGTPVVLYPAENLQDGQRIERM